MSNRLKPYYGEFLFSAVPLELSLVEPCDYACAYCFAVLGDRYWAQKTGNRVHSQDAKSVMSLLGEYQQRRTLEAVLLQQGYPVLLSNRTDPFGRKNRSLTLPVLDTLAELGIRVAFQTKGFTQHDKDFEKVMGLVPDPCWWYISISFANDADRQRVEPGAPPIEYRFELIKELVRRGHSVSVGVNPCVPEWVGDPEPFVQRIKDSGAYGAFAAALHLSKDHVSGMTAREIESVGSDVIARARKKINPDSEFVEAFTDLALEAGLESSRQGFSNYTLFWDYCHRCYPKTFPTNQDFVNACFEANLPEGEIISLENYLDVMLPRLPEGVTSVGHYIGANCRAVTRERKGQWTNYFTFKELLEWYWRESRLGLSLSNHGCFSYAARIEGDEVIGLTDDQGAPLLIFMPNTAESYYTDVDTLEPIA